MIKFDGSQVNLLVAFLAGVITFFASCLLPLVPTYLAYLSGIVVTKTGKLKERGQRINLLTNSLLFTLGFVLAFVILGVSANSLGTFLVGNKVLIQRLGGIWLIFMGLFMLGVAKSFVLNKERRFFIRLENPKFHYLNSVLFGLTFGFAWTPCIGPVLAVILFWASQAETVFAGASLLLVYGLGLGFPFILLALLFDRITPLLSKLNSFRHKINILAALIIVAMGILLVLGKVEVVSIGLLRLLGLDTLSV